MLPQTPRYSPLSLIEGARQKPLSPATMPPGVDVLLEAMQKLSLARDLDTVMAIVREAARALTGADGATFVLRDNGQCFYADESAISPLWKGFRFPMSICISGWTMLNAKICVIPDIYKDARIPINAYQPTFVKSLAMVPIRMDQPIGAIGTYWAQHHTPSEHDLSLLQMLANATSVAMENNSLYDQLNAKITTLEETNYELSRFAWVASHDLREPLRTIAMQLQLLERRSKETLDKAAQQSVTLAIQGANRLQHLINSMLVHAQAEKVEDFTRVNLSDVLKNVLTELDADITATEADINCVGLPVVTGNEQLLAGVLHNLISNAINYRKRDEAPRILISYQPQESMWVFAVRDNGIGIAPEFQQKIFGIFERLHGQEDRPGAGLGLAVARKIIGLHGGKMWLESAPNEGSTFYFTLPRTANLSGT